MMGHECETNWGISLLIVGVFLWLNDSYGWFNWPQFIAILIVVEGLVMLFSKHTCAGSMCAAPAPVRKKRRR